MKQPLSFQHFKAYSHTYRSQTPLWMPLWIGCKVSYAAYYTVGVIFIWIIRSIRTEYSVLVFFANSNISHTVVLIRLVFDTFRASLITLYSKWRLSCVQVHKDVFYVFVLVFLLLENQYCNLPLSLRNNKVTIFFQLGFHLSLAIRSSRSLFIHFSYFSHLYQVNNYRK